MKHSAKIVGIVCLVCVLLVVAKHPISAQTDGSVCGRLTTVELPFNFVFIPDRGSPSDPSTWWLVYDGFNAGGVDIDVYQLENSYLRLWYPDFVPFGGELWGDTVPLLVSAADYEVVADCNQSPTPTPTRRPPTATPTRTNTPRPLPTAASTPTSGIPWGCAGFGQCAQPAPTPIPAELGAKAQTSAALRIRTEPRTSGSVLVTVPIGTQMYILQGPIAANGYTWWKVQTIAANRQPSVTGWAAGNWLTIIPGETGAPKMTLRYAVTPLASQQVTVFKPNVMELTIANEGTAPFVLSARGDYRIDIKLSEGSRSLDSRTFSPADDPTLPGVAALLPGEQVRFRVPGSFYFLHSVPRGTLSISFVTGVASTRPRIQASSSRQITITQHEESVFECSAELLKGAALVFPASAPIALPAAYAAKLFQCGDDWDCAAREFFWYFTELLTINPHITDKVQSAVQVATTVNDFFAVAAAQKPVCMIAGDAFGAYGFTWVDQMGKP